MVCSLKQYKGIFEFIEISKKCISNPFIHFVLVLNAEQEEINNYLNSSQLPSNIEIFPRQTDLRIFYTKASLLMNLSRPDEWIETFGLTILEGMAYALPVIVPPIGGPAEIITEGREGFLISCYETQRISKVIDKLASDPNLYSRLSCEAHARSKDFNLDSFEENIIRIIDL